jgi:hypothetical protein
MADGGEGIGGGDTRDTRDTGDEKIRIRSKSRIRRGGIARCLGEAG